MKTRIEKVTDENQSEVLAAAAKIIREGGLVAFPTETVYGLGANGLDGNAAQKIYAAKNRPTDNPLILHIHDINGLYAVAGKIGPEAVLMAQSFWPGPLTLILPKADAVPLQVSAGLDTVAVRMPSHPIALELIKCAGVPIAAPSANSSGKPSPTRASHVEYDMGGQIDMIIDGGPCEIGIESTILDLSGDVPTILRPGGITAEEIRQVLGSVEVHVSKDKDSQSVVKAPGMKYTHYSPEADVVIVKGEIEKTVEKIRELSSVSRAGGKRVGIMATEQSQELYWQLCEYDVLLMVGNRDEPNSIAANLFKMLRRFDQMGCDIVYTESFNTDGIGAAIMNRLDKSAEYRVILEE